MPTRCMALRSAARRFAWSGNFALEPLTSSGKFEVSALKATTIWSYLREGLPFEFTKGTLDLNGEYFYAASEEGGLRFDIHKIGVTDFGMRPPGKDYDYIEVASLALEETEVAVRTSRVNIGRVRLDGGAVRAARDAAGNINLTEFAAETPARGTRGHRRSPHPAAAARHHQRATRLGGGRAGHRHQRRPRRLRRSAGATHGQLRAHAGGPQRHRIHHRAREHLPGRGHGQGREDRRSQDQGAVRPRHRRVSPRTSKSANSTSPRCSPISPPTRRSRCTAAGCRAPWTWRTRRTACSRPRATSTLNKFAAIDNALKQDLLKWDRVAATGIDYSSSPRSCTSRGSMHAPLRAR